MKRTNKQRTRKTPFPAVKGLWQKPTLLNNVETYANVPQIILNGAEAPAEKDAEEESVTAYKDEVTDTIGDALGVETTEE